jgi:putative lipoic acid-binding regulatory protein
MENFDRLKEQLLLQEWPNVYLFKFIMPSDSEKIALVSGLFDEDAVLTLHPSKNGNYTSLSAKVVMMDVEAIISVYTLAAKFEGVISL